MQLRITNSHVVALSNSDGYLQVSVQRSLQQAVAPHVSAEQKQSGRSGGDHGLPIEVLTCHRSQGDVLPSENLE